MNNITKTHLSTVSALLIVKDEEKHLDKCLSKLTWCDEIIIVDSGSSDRTLEIAKNYTDRIYNHPDWKGFGKQRQIVQNYALCEWLLWVDADEQLSDELILEIQLKLSNPIEKTAFSFNRLSKCYGFTIRYSGLFPDYVVRLYRQDEGVYSDDLVHERVILNPEISAHKLQHILHHDTYKNLEQHSYKSAKYAVPWAEQRYMNGQRASIATAIGHAVWTFIRMYFLKRGFLGGKVGLVLAMASSYGTFSKYIELWLLEYSNKKEQ